MTDERKPNPIDVRVGRNVRLTRKRRKVSQTELAERLGLTFQQVQKYERGTNRVSASKLYEMAQFLDVRIEALFEDLEQLDDAKGDDAALREAYDFIASPEGLEVARLFSRIPRPGFRRKLLELLREMQD